MPYDVIKAALGDSSHGGRDGMSGELMGVNLFDYDATAVSVVYATSVEGGAVTASARRRGSDGHGGIGRRGQGDDYRDRDPQCVRPWSSTRPSRMWPSSRSR